MSYTAFVLGSCINKYHSDYNLKVSSRFNICLIEKYSQIMDSLKCVLDSTVVQGCVP